MQLHPYGLVLGRFQPLHIGHMEFLQAAKSRCDRLIVGVTNPDVREMVFHNSDPKRSLAGSNPFTFFQRFEMLERALSHADWKPQDFVILPAEISNPHALSALLPDPASTVVLSTIYDQWGEEKVKRMREQGFQVEIMWRRTMEQRATSGTEIRARMSAGTSWTHLVPAGVAELLETYSEGTQ